MKYAMCDIAVLFVSLSVHDTPVLYQNG